MPQNQELADRFNAAFKQSLQSSGVAHMKIERHHIDAVKQKITQMREAGIDVPDGVEHHLESLAGVDLSSLNFCQIWPKANQGINVVEMILGFFLPASYVAIFKALFAAINSTIIPEVCPAHA